MYLIVFFFIYYLLFKDWPFMLEQALAIWNGLCLVNHWQRCFAKYIAKGWLIMLRQALTFWNVLHDWLTVDGRYLETSCWSIFCSFAWTRLVENYAGPMINCLYRLGISLQWSWQNIISDYRPMLDDRLPVFA